jgi:hypothetical protein
MNDSNTIRMARAILAEAASDAPTHRAMAHRGAVAMRRDNPSLTYGQAASEASRRLRAGATALSTPLTGSRLALHNRAVTMRTAEILRERPDMTAAHAATIASKEVAHVMNNEAAGSASAEYNGPQRGITQPSRGKYSRFAKELGLPENTPDHEVEAEVMRRLRRAGQAKIHHDGQE